MYTHRSIFRSLLAIPLLVVTACGAPEDDTTMDATGEETPAETPADEMTAAEPAGEVSVMLEALNESGVTGTAVATHRNDSVVVEVQVQGAPDAEELPAHIHEGDCATGGSVLVPLNPVTVTDGMGSSTTTLSAAQIPADQAAYVQVHGTDRAPVACGDLPGHGEGM